MVFFEAAETADTAEPAWDAALKVGALKGAAADLALGALEAAFVGMCGTLLNCAGEGRGR
jgi:hypothetical protein